MREPRVQTLQLQRGDRSGRCEQFVISFGNGRCLVPLMEGVILPGMGAFASWSGNQRAVYKEAVSTTAES